jgi:hypothetical protein
MCARYKTTLFTCKTLTLPTCHTLRRTDSQVAPSLGSITIESAGAIRPREILVTVSSCLDANPVLTTADASMVEVQEQASGMGGPFGLSVDTAGTETL